MNKKKKKSPEELQIENELLKLKMRAESGAIFYNDDNAELPPEIENQFLNSIREFESKLREAEVVTIGQILNHPKFISEKKLSDKELVIELKRIDLLFSRNGIVLHRENDADQRMLYRFITGKFMKVETDNIKIDGFTHNFIFEEFFPDINSNIRMQTESFIRDLFSQNPDWVSTHLHNLITKQNGKRITKDQALKIMQNFQSAFDELKQPEIEITSIIKTKLKATVTAKMYYKGYAGGKAVEQKGNAVIKLRKDSNDLWNISALQMPGLVI